MAGASRTASFLVISSFSSGSAQPPLRDEGLLSEATERSVRAHEGPPTRFRLSARRDAAQRGRDARLGQRHHPIGRKRHEGTTGSQCREGIARSRGERFPDQHPRAVHQRAGQRHDRTVRGRGSIRMPTGTPTTSSMCSSRPGASAECCSSRVARSSPTTSRQLVFHRRR